MKDNPESGVYEHRLAIVMNGGVSLAVWMGGVAFELDNLRRASSGLTGPGAATEGPRADAEREVFRLWGDYALRRSTPRRFTIDVIAGTSAGGLNGVLLGTAIASGSRLDSLREVWMSDGQLSAEALLEVQGSDAQSILAGDYFRTQIRNAVEALNQQRVDDDGCNVSLTVTATGTSGAGRPVQDRTGTWSTVPDHRRRYDFHRANTRFTYNPSAASSLTDGFDLKPRNDFINIDAVADAARASASFPAAFAPPREEDFLRAFRVWPTWDLGNGSQYLADGGILDNAPFEPVLEAISRQPVTGPWLRTLCYVVPSAGDRTAQTPDGPPDAEGLPPSWLSVVNDAIGMPREVDLRDDIERLHQVIRSGRTDFDLMRLTDLLENQPVVPDEPPTTGTRAPEDARTAEQTALGPSPVYPFDIAIQLAAAGFPLYRQARGASGVYEAIDLMSDTDPSAYLTPASSIAEDQYAGTRPWLPRTFLDRAATKAAGSLPALTDAPLATFTDGWAWGLAASERLTALLLRSLSDGDGESRGDVRRDLSEIRRKIAAVRYRVERGIAGTDPDIALPTNLSTADRIDAVYTSLGVSDALGRLVNKAVNIYADEPSTPAVSATQVLLASLCIEVSNGVVGTPNDLRPRPKFDFMRMGIANPPECFLASFKAADSAAQQNSQRLPAAGDILYGTRLGHFAAFGRKQWRRWDWMWGRIHAAVQLGQLLDLDTGQVDALVRNIVEAEGFSVEKVTTTIGDVLRLTPDNLFNDMARDGTAKLAVDAVFRLLGSNAQTSPRTPTFLKPLGAAGALQRPTGLSGLEEGLRTVAAPARLGLRLFLRQRGKKGRAPELE